MAETVNPSAKNPAAPAPEPTPAPPVAAPAPKKPESQWLNKIVSFMSVPVMLILGAVLLVLFVLMNKGVIALPQAIKDLLEKAPIIKEFFDQVLPNLPALFGGFGCLFLGLARGTVANEYADLKKKNRQYPDAWKIPLIRAQAIFFYITFVYGVLVAFGRANPVTSPMTMVLLLLFFFIYIIIYLFEHARHRLPSIAALRMSILTVGLAAAACALWVFQICFPALVVAVLALVTLFISVFVRIKGVEQVLFWPRTTLLIVSALLLAHVTWYALPFGNPWMDLVSLKSTESLSGNLAYLSYFQPGKNHDGTKLAVSRKDKDGWVLHLLNPDHPTLDLYDMPNASSEEFHTIFIQNGRYLLADLTKGSRGIWKIDCENGKATQLKASGIEPLGDGTPWSERNGQLLYVTRSEGKYQLKILTLATGKSIWLFSSENPILTPSWVNVSNPKVSPFWSKYDEKVAYADGNQGLFYVLDLRTNTRELLKSDMERMQGEKFKPVGKVVKVLTSPDNFRYAYLSQIGNKSVISVVGADGDRRDPIYETTATLGKICWHPESQQLIIEEKHEGWHRWDLGFFLTYSNVKILDANLGTATSLIPPQVSHYSPAVSPDGVKVAFVASEGLWYPSLNDKSGIWIATLR